MSEKKQLCMMCLQPYPEYRSDLHDCVTREQALANQKAAIEKAVEGLRKTEEFGHRGFNSAIDKALQAIKEATG